MAAGIPTGVGRYTIDRLLGSGAMGFVYLGRDPELDRAVAIKTIRKLSLDEDARALFLERFRNEARAAARLHHPSIVQIYDVGEDEAIGPYLVFEYVPGSTLRQVIKGSGPMDPEALVRLAEQIAGALDRAHQHGIIHRDIKPDNLLMTAAGDAKLADFGIARVPNAALTKEGQFLGTPCYAAPETLMEGQYGPASDIFSLAAVLYEAATGARAFPGDDAIAVAHKVVKEEPPRPSEVRPELNVPSEIDDVIMRGLSKDASKRYGTPTHMAGALRSAYEARGLIRAHDPAHAARTLGGATLDERGDRGGLPRWAFAAVLLAIGAAGLVMIGSFAPEDQESGERADAGAASGAMDAGHDALDAGPSIVIIATSEDGGASIVVEPVDDLRHLDAHQREEAAKDALAMVRRLVRAGDEEGARRELERARRYDPGNPDTASLARELGLSP